MALKICSLPKQESNIWCTDILTLENGRDTKYQNKWTMLLDGSPKTKQSLWRTRSWKQPVGLVPALWDLTSNVLTSSHWKIAGFAALSAKALPEAYIIRLTKRNFIFDLHESLEPTPDINQINQWYVLPEKEGHNMRLPIKQGRNSAGVFYGYRNTEYLARAISWDARGYRVELLTVAGDVVKRYEINN